MKDLIRFLGELDNELKLCTRCGMCQSVCPLFKITGREEDVARGKLALIDNLKGDLFKSPAGVEKRLSRCLLCGACFHNCPRGVNTLRVFMRARMIINGYRGLSFPWKILLRLIIARPAVFNFLSGQLGRCRELPAGFRGETPEGLPGRLERMLASGRHIVPPASEPFHKSDASKRGASGNRKIKAAFFTGCLIDNFYPRVAEASLKALDRHNIEAVVPENQGCCGMPAVSGGDATSFRRLIRHNLTLFDAEKYDYIVTACATCAFAIKKLWPMMVEDESGDIRHQVQRLSEKTFEISSFMVNVAGVTASKTDGTGKGGRRVTFHDPCHLKKSLGISDEPRVLIEKTPGAYLAEMAEADSCCGFGGSFGIRHYDLSRDIGRRKYDNIIASEAGTVATACPACMMQISDMMSKSCGNVEIKHVIEVYAESLNNDNA